MEFLSSGHLIVILIVLLLVFGNRLPNVMRSLGKSVTEFKKGMNEITDPTNVPQQPAQSQQAAPQSQNAVAVAPVATEATAPTGAPVTAAAPQPVEQPAAPAAQVPK